VQGTSLGGFLPFFYTQRETDLGQAFPAGFFENQTNRVLMFVDLLANLNLGFSRDFFIFSSFVFLIGRCIAPWKSDSGWCASKLIHGNGMK
jgi:hypothetical protein